MLGRELQAWNGGKLLNPGTLEADASGSLQVEVCLVYIGSFKSDRDTKRDLTLKKNN